MNMLTTQKIWLSLHYSNASNENKWFLNINTKYSAISHYNKLHITEVPLLINTENVYFKQSVGTLSIKLEHNILKKHLWNTENS